MERPGGPAGPVAVTRVVAPYATAATAEEALSLKGLSDTITRFVPLTLYQEASAVLLNPSPAFMRQEVRA
jgi:hypothetical protein